MYTNKGVGIIRCKTFKFPQLRNNLFLYTKRNISGHSDNTGSNHNEVIKFNKLADSWWEPNGSSRLLNRMNLARIEFIDKTIEKTNKDLVENKFYSEFVNRYNNGKLNVLDVGCGGGIFSESIARRPEIHSVLGIDISKEIVKIANNHKRLDPLLEKKLSYKVKSIDQVVINDVNSKGYDIVSLFEILEHVNSPSNILKEAMDRVRPGGFIFLSTINRTAFSYLTTILFAQDIVHLVPDDVHQWRKYINHDEIRDFIHNYPNWSLVMSKGTFYFPALGWKLLDDYSSGNYLWRFVGFLN